MRVKNAKIVLRTNHGKPDLRVHFVDPVFDSLAIKVTDLRLWQSDQATPAEANIERIKNALDDCYLAVGLSRAFPVSSYEGVWHWLQVNNVFPVADSLWARE